MIKQISCIAIIIAGVLFMSSCMPVKERISRLLMTSDERAATKCYEQVVKALEKQDKEAIKSMFSKQALGEAEDFDENLDQLFEIFDSKFEPYNFDHGYVGERIDYGKREKEIHLGFDIKVNESTFFYLIDYPVNTLNPDKKGLYALRVTGFEEDITTDKKRFREYI